MKPSESIKPISYLKSHASEIVRTINETQKTMIITQNGEAKIVIQDIKSYEEMQDSIAMLKILALSEASIRNGTDLSLEESFTEMDKHIRKMKDGV